MRIGMVALLVTLAAAPRDQSSQVNRPWPPAVQSVSPESAPLAPADALAAPDIPARILLGGKEGPVGLMPPVGSVLSDEQIAAVLTSIRREWGQAGTPVEPATVKDVRTATAGRTRPWTHDELMKLAGGG
jgi:hypothetical protein